MHDIEPATRDLARVLVGVHDGQLDAPTPCGELRVRDLVDHIEGFASAFTAAATKVTGPDDQAPRADGSRIGTNWRTRTSSLLAGLAAAWRDPAAWEGMTRAGGADLPAPLAGLVAIDETIVHGWDLARATGQRYSCPNDLVEAAMEFVLSAVEQNPEGSPGLFGPPVLVPSDAPPLDQLVGLTGRDPAWEAARG
ncbi:MAG: TIGR03086 family metal-binding protein [Acidimicrobiales bacterium]